MKKFYSVLVIIVAAILIGTILVIRYMYRPEAKTSSVSADYTLTAEELAREIKADSAKASAHYRDKYITLSGKISEVTKDNLGRPNVDFAVDAVTIQCAFEDTAHNLNLSANRPVKLKGKFTGLMSDDLVPGNVLAQMKACVLDEDKK